MVHSSTKGDIPWWPSARSPGDGREDGGGSQVRPKGGGAKAHPRGSAPASQDARWEGGHLRFGRYTYCTYACVYIDMYYTFM